MSSRLAASSSTTPTRIADDVTPPSATVSGNVSVTSSAVLAATHSQHRALPRRQAVRCSRWRGPTARGNRLWASLVLVSRVLTGAVRAEACASMKLSAHPPAPASWPHGSPRCSRRQRPGCLTARRSRCAGRASRAAAHGLHPRSAIFALGAPGISPQPAPGRRDGARGRDPPSSSKGTRGPPTAGTAMSARSIARRFHCQRSSSAAWQGRRPTTIRVQ